MSAALAPDFGESGEKVGSSDACITLGQGLGNNEAFEGGMGQRLKRGSPHDPTRDLRTSLYILGVQHVKLSRSPTVHEKLLS